MQKISAVLITYNEASIIAKTLENLAWCDEIVVVDSGSDDETVKICEQYACKVYYKKFEGFGTQKQYAVACASYDWILSIDADEILSVELQNELQNLKKLEKLPANAYNIPRSLIFMEQKIRFGGEYRNLQLRFFNRKFANFNDLSVHESVLVQDKKVLALKSELLHYSYKNLADYFTKLNHYTSLAADKLFAENKRQPLPILMIRFPFDFLYKYIFQGLIFDGFAGFIWALFSSISPVVKYSKVEEKRLIHKKHKHQ
jgi:glycosyltransferase involved in cell wall biosynthesis